MTNTNSTPTFKDLQAKLEKLKEAQKPIRKKLRRKEPYDPYVVTQEYNGEFVGELNSITIALDKISKIVLHSRKLHEETKHNKPISQKLAFQLAHTALKQHFLHLTSQLNTSNSDNRLIKTITILSYALARQERIEDITKFVEISKAEHNGVGSGRPGVVDFRKSMERYKNHLQQDIAQDAIQIGDGLLYTAIYDPSTHQPTPIIDYQLIRLINAHKNTIAEQVADNHYTSDQVTKELETISTSLHKSHTRHVEDANKRYTTILGLPLPKSYQPTADSYINNSKISQEIIDDFYQQHNNCEKSEAIILNANSLLKDLVGKIISQDLGKAYTDTVADIQKELKGKKRIKLSNLQKICRTATRIATGETDTEALQGLITAAQNKSVIKPNDATKEINALLYNYSGIVPMVAQKNGFRSITGRQESPSVTRIPGYVNLHIYIDPKDPKSLKQLKEKARETVTEILVNLKQGKDTPPISSMEKTPDSSLAPERIKGNGKQTKTGSEQEKAASR